MSNEENQASGLSRRTVVKGAAWSVPVVSLALATPAVAGSIPTGAVCGTDYTVLPAPDTVSWLEVKNISTSVVVVTIATSTAFYPAGTPANATGLLAADYNALYTDNTPAYFEKLTLSTVTPSDPVSWITTIGSTANNVYYSGNAQSGVFSLFIPVGESIYLSSENYGPGGSIRSTWAATPAGSCLPAYTTHSTV